MPCRILLALAIVTLLPAHALAGDDPGAVPAAQARRSPDFLFGAPRITLAVRGLYLLPRARSDWFDFVTDELTLERSDFRSFGIAGDVGIVLTPRLDLVVGADWTGRTAESEYRNFVDNNRLPIAQTTRLRRQTYTAGVRLGILERGREISALAWVPSRFIPYVGGGVGAMYYEVIQFGDFVDFETFEVFPDRFESRGWAPTGYVGAGADVNLYRSLYVTIDGRYHWADSDLGDDWIGFEPLDLGGVRLSTGVSFVF